MCHRFALLVLLSVKSRLSGPTATEESRMKTNRNSLALRRQSIRTLTPGELSIAHGGQGNVKTGTCIPTRTTTRTKK
jgi:hypothetical protein